jgi:hypothetical protein
MRSTPGPRAGHARGDSRAAAAREQPLAIGG